MEEDGYNQGQYFHRITELGQTACEVIDDKKCEFYVLETIILKSMRERQQTLYLLKEQLAQLQKCTKYLVRHDDVSITNFI